MTAEAVPEAIVGEVLGEVCWEAGFGPLDAVGLCPHDCVHQYSGGAPVGSYVVAVGATERTYQLRECIDCHCRAWFTSRQMRADIWRQVQR